MGGCYSTSDLNGITGIKRKLDKAEVRGTTGESILIIDKDG